MKAIHILSCEYGLESDGVTRQSCNVTCCWILPSSVTTQCVVARAGSANSIQINTANAPRTERLQNRLLVE